MTLKGGRLLGSRRTEPAWVMGDKGRGREGMHRTKGFEMKSRGPSLASQLSPQKSEIAPVALRWEREGKGSKGFFFFLPGEEKGNISLVRVLTLSPSCHEHSGMCSWTSIFGRQREGEKP